MVPTRGGLADPDAALPLPLLFSKGNLRSPSRLGMMELWPEVPLMAPLSSSTTDSLFLEIGDMAALHLDTAITVTDRRLSKQELHQGSRAAPFPLFIMQTFRTGWSRAQAAKANRACRLNHPQCRA